MKSTSRRSPLQPVVQALCVAFALISFGSSASAQSVDDVLARHFEAIGGAEAWQSMNTTRSIGTLTLMGGAAQGNITSTAMRPAMLRADIVVQGQTVVQAFDGESSSGGKRTATRSSSWGPRWWAR